MKISLVDEMRSMDRYAVDRLGIPEEILMENAGMASVRVLEKEVGIRGRRFCVFCGIGNNGGDGLVVARGIHSRGGDVRVFLLGDPERYRGAARMNWTILQGLSVHCRRIATAEEARVDVLHARCLVDALLGTGLDREVGGLFREVISLINASGKPVLSLDIPSGIHGDTGEILGAAVDADWTVTFGLPKLGNMLYPGYGRGGTLYVCHISFPPSLYERPDLLLQCNGNIPLPPRPPTAHKGSVGKTLFIAGAAAYLGAPLFAAQSFLRAGGGYARLATPASIAPFLAGRGSEIVFVPQKETTAGSIALENLDRLLALSEQSDLVVLGPGLSVHDETRELVRELVSRVSRPLLIDGDGITAVADHPDVVAGRMAATVLTPHLGELSRLTGKDIRELDRQKVPQLRKCCRDLGAIVVLKGPHSLIGYADGRIFVNMSGNPGMATAGAGDVLTGTIAAMYGLGLPVPEAARKGVYIHGLAGDLAAEAKGQDGLIAGDIMDCLPAAMKVDREGGFRNSEGDPRDVQVV